MKKNSMMSVNAMIDLYARYGAAEETWGMLYNMTIHGLISSDNWSKFFDTCASWECEGNVIVDGDGNVVYHIDDNGFWVKAA